MKGKWLSLVVLAFTAATLLNSASCGHSQELVSIQIQPPVQTFGASNIPVPLDTGLQVQLRALGTYVHPPVTKDITDQVAWVSNTTQMVTVNSTGLATATGDTCGNTLISATVNTNSDASGLSSSGAIITGYMTANVVCFTGNGTGAGPALTLTFAGSGAGNVSSMPSGLSCSSAAGACVTEFPAGTEITLLATPTGTSTFGGWTGCASSPSTNPCTVTLEANTTVTVAFN